MGKIRNFISTGKTSFVLWQRLKKIDLNEKLIPKIDNKFECSQRTVQEAFNHYLTKTTRKHAQKIWMDKESKTLQQRKKVLEESTPRSIKIGQ